MIELHFKDKDAARFVHHRVRDALRHQHDEERLHATRAYNSTIKVPDASTLQRAQAIADEIKARYWI